MTKQKHEERPASRAITLSKLRRARACRNGIERFRYVFGEKTKSVDVTVALCAEHAQEGPWEWLALFFLSGTACVEFMAARIKTKRAYNREINAAARKHLRPSFSERDHETFNAIATKAWGAHNIVLAETWARLYISEAPTKDTKKAAKP